MADRSASDNHWSELAIPLTIGTLFFLINLRWIYLFRTGQPLDIDEAGYLSISLGYFSALTSGGLGSWIAALEAPSTHAPVTTVLSSIAYAILVPHPLVGFLVILSFGLVTVLSTYFLGKVIGGRRLAILSSIVVACSPIIINYSRSYHFAGPATAVAMFGLLALAKSERLSRFSWSIVFGVCVGLLPLTRTMAIAFVPAFAVAAIIQAAYGEDRRRRLYILVLSLGIALLTAAIWYVPNGRLVFQYLFSFGYGPRAASYGPGQESVLGLQNLLFFLQTLGAYVYLPNFALILSGLALLTLRVISRWRTAGFREGFDAILLSPALPAALLVLEGALALASSQNKGSAFIAPLVPPMLLLAVWGWTGWEMPRVWQRLASALVIAVAIISLVPSLDLRLRAARPWLTEMPFIGGIYVTDGRGTIQKYEAAGGYSTDDPRRPISAPGGSEWMKTIAASAERIGEASGDGTMPIAMAIRHYLFNTNTLHLARLLAGKRQLLIWGIETDVIGDTVPAYSTWLTSRTYPCFLLTSSAGKGEMVPAVNVENMERAASNAGFRTIDEWPLPDYRRVKLWRSDNPGCGVKNVEAGDKFGQVRSLSSGELFVHPGAKTPTSFDVPIEGGWRALNLEIPEGVLKSCPDANGATVRVQIGGEEVWEGTIRPGQRETIELPGKDTRDVKFVVGNNGQPNCDHLRVKFVR